MAIISVNATIASIGDPTGLLNKKMPITKYFVKCITLELDNEEKLMVNIDRSMTAPQLHATFNIGDQVVANIKVCSRIWNARMLTYLQLESYSIVRAVPVADNQVAVPLQSH